MSNVDEQKTEVADDGLKTEARLITSRIRGRYGYRRFWLYPDDTLLPVIAGGAPDGDGGDDQGDDADTGDKGDSDEGDNTAEKIFTQADVDALSGRIRAEEKTKAAREYLGKGVEDIRKELREELKKYQESKNKPQQSRTDDEGKTKVVDDSASKKRIEELEAKLLDGEKREKASRELDIVNSIRDIAAKYNAVDTAEVAQLIRTRLKIGDGGELVPVNDLGEIIGAADGSQKPMSLKAFVKSWLTERPHHLRSSGSQGAGSQGASFNGNKEKIDLSKLPPVARINAARKAGVK